MFYFYFAVASLQGKGHFGFLICLIISEQSAPPSEDVESAVQGLYMSRVCTWPAGRSLISSIRPPMTSWDLLRLPCRVLPGVAHLHSCMAMFLTVHSLMLCNIVTLILLHEYHLSIILSLYPHFILQIIIIWNIFLESIHNIGVFIYMNMKILLLMRKPSLKTHFSISGLQVQWCGNLIWTDCTWTLLQFPILTFVPPGCGWCCLTATHSQPGTCPSSPWGSDFLSRWSV